MLGVTSQFSRSWQGFLLSATLSYSVRAPVLCFSRPTCQSHTRSHQSLPSDVVMLFFLLQAGNALSFLQKGTLGAKTKLFSNIQITYGMTCLIYELIIERDSALSILTVVFIL